MRSPRPVLFITDDLGGGGSERAFVQVISGLRKKRADVDWRILLLKKSGVFLREIPAGIPVEELSAGGGYLVKNATRLLRLVAWQRNHRPVAVVSFMYHVNQLVLASAFLAPSSRRIVVEQCALGVDHATGQRVAIPAAKRALARRLYARADEIVAISHGIAGELSAEMGLASERCRIIPNPIDRERLGRVPTLKRDPAHFTFGFLGRFVEQKNLPLMLRAFAAVREARREGDPPIKLKMIGDGRLAGELHSLASQLGLADAIEWTGFLAEPWSALAGCDALLLSSNFEGMGNVIVEAWALGLPVVSTACDFGPSELIGEDPRLGIVTPVGDLMSFADAMGNLVRSRVIWAEGGEWRRAHAERYSIERIVDLYEEAIFP